MQVISDHIKLVVGVGLLAIFLAACTSPAVSVKDGATATARAQPSTSKPTPQSTAEDKRTPTAAPEATSTPTPTVEPTPTGTPSPQLTEECPPRGCPPITPQPAPVHTLLLREKQGTPHVMALDDTYLYWALHKGGRIFRYPLVGGEVETVASTRFEDGELTVLPPIRSGDWLIFLDTPRSAEGVTWTLRALNLSDGTEQVVIEEAGDRTSWPGPLVDADGDWVVWSRTSRSEDKDCVETILAMYNLRTGERRELERSCAEDQHMWVFPHLSDDLLVVEQDLPDSKGGGNNIYLYDLTSGERTALTEDGRSSMPAISIPWVAWKAAPRFSYGPTLLYNLDTEEQEVIHCPRCSQLGPQLAGHWLYWQPSAKKPLYVYDLEAEQLLLVATPGENEDFEDVGIYDDTIAWCLDLDSEHAPPEDYLLEWRTLP